MSEDGSSSFDWHAWEEFTARGVGASAGEFRELATEEFDDPTDGERRGTDGDRRDARRAVTRAQTRDVCVVLITESRGCHLTGNLRPRCRADQLAPPPDRANRSSPSALTEGAPRSRRDGGHDGRPGEHPREDIPAVGRLPRQARARGASKTRARASRSFPPERHRTSTVENATIFERSSSPRACLDPAERALTVPDPFDTRRARSNLTSCTSSCDSPPPSASTAFRMVRTPARERCRPEITNATSTPSSSSLRFDNRQSAR